MPVSRKRKASAIVEDQQPSTQPRTTKTAKCQKPISAFGTISKPDVTANDGKKRKTTHRREVTPPPPLIAKPASKSEKKRKRCADIESDDEIALSPRTTTIQAPTHSHVASTPVSKRKKHAQPPTPAETPSKSAAALFDKLNIDLNSRANPIALPTKKLDYDTPPDTPADEIELELSLPAELEELQEIYSAFLAALSLYYSHNGTSVPVEVQALLPMITKHWKKRAVTQLDLQRVLAVVPMQDREFKLEVAGRAGLRLYRAEPHGRGMERAASYIEETKMNSRFENALQKAWYNWQSVTSGENRRTGNSFVEQIQLLDITMNDCAEKTAPLFARGQQRLADIKAGQTAKTDAKSTKLSPVAAPTPQSTESRSTALLDRILKKSQMASTLPTGPTRTELERKYALQRIEDVARVLSLMCGIKERSSFSMEAVAQQLQQSLRNPISQTEVRRCLSLMSTEITPEFVKVVQSGEVQGVIVTKSGNVGLAELRRRVQSACA